MEIPPLFQALQNLPLQRLTPDVIGRRLIAPSRKAYRYKG
jgi:hypothetical protein